MIWYIYLRHKQLGYLQTEELKFDGRNIVTFLMRELFCKKHFLTLFVNILSGAIFLSDANNLLLPPLAIATQIVQSVAILVQNVSCATSLYFILSNNHINKMIRLPIQLYTAAEGELLRSKKISLNRQHSAEIAELLTYFFYFLKGLTMRMNAETLQFFCLIRQRRH